MELPVSVTPFAPKLLSGIDVIDDGWGGLYRGGSYLVYGRAISGRGLLSLMFTQTGTLLGEQCLLISPERPRDLMIHAASIGFDLRKAHETGRVKLMRIPPVFSLQNAGDDGVSRALHDLVTIIRQHQPGRVVISDFTPFVLFKSFDRLRTEFIQMLDEIEPLNTTVMIGMSEPASRRSDEVIEFIKTQMTGSIHLELEQDDDTNTRRRITLIPNIGHFKRLVQESWDLESLVDSGEKISAAVRMLPETPRTPAPSQIKPAFPSSAPPASEPASPPAEPTVASSTPPAPIATETRPAPTRPRSTVVTTNVIVPPPVAPKPSEAKNIFTSRSAFAEHLRVQFTARDEQDTPFLLLALRMDPSTKRGARPFDFEFILDLVGESLRPQDALLAGTDHERLVVSLGDSRPEEAQNFFARLKNRLREDAPEQSDHLLHAVSAIVVPDGRPFQNAEEFLAYALDEA